MSFLKSDKLMMIEGAAKHNIFLDTFCLKYPVVLKISLGMFDIKIAIEPTAIKL